ncbi:hypothetical protein DI383_08130 [Flavobacteriaceae bacterium LYZ1037]|nr:hypothetical protein DI383_08130 [Flavobacteriaceae bacterium LYZ1037]
MKALKDNLLEKCHSDFINICFGDFPIREVKNSVSQNITGYGTNINEKIRSFLDFISLLNMQREESEGIDMTFDFVTISKTVFSEGKSAVFIDEGSVKMTIDNKPIELFVRLSSIFEFENMKWMTIHFHGSFPQGEEGDPDTWSVNEWKQKNERLEQLIEKRTEELRQSLEHLKATQTQLIHSEKMASLGELTAGIAHEIQNPLNFVNNFSEVSYELVDEMNDELDKRDIEEAKHIALDIKQNLEKINHHGKRADSIVKGMLQHSRKNTGKKEPTDINKLADEYLRLAYHGLRAKDKSFNTTIITDFDDSIEKVNLIPQDIGRVILNIITNAFYVVDEKKKSEIKNYEPTVTISTKQRGKNIEIYITDNGNGIPKTILNRIFEPFFTTKPTGQGTGLGLSMSYDIIKAHNGELKVDTIKNEGTTFSILLFNNKKSNR